jgi:hypothetical protein
LAGVLPPAAPNSPAVMEETSELDGVRPWERGGAVRRDCEPHRAEMLCKLAEIASLLAVLAVICGVLALASLPLGFAVYRMAGHDLDQMGAGTMDREGEHKTREVLTTHGEPDCFRLSQRWRGCCWYSAA